MLFFGVNSYFAILKLSLKYEILFCYAVVYIHVDCVDTERKSFN